MPMRTSTRLIVLRRSPPYPVASCLRLATRQSMSVPGHTVLGVEEALLEEPEHSQDEALFDGPASSSAAPLALYRRYRPDTFAEVIGQDHVTEPLQRALTNNRVNHAYLFSGPRGCGKTTSARILARCLNCEKGPRAVPCGECRSCRDLARNAPGSIDVIEIDAASHGGVDDARDLRERAFFAPVSSRFKIYIVDEAHLVTTAGFNALLKLVEEPPPHVKFVFATTEPDKVIATIRSRTHHYPFRLVPPRLLTEYLAKLCDAEGISVEPAVLPLVVRAGGGSVRDSLSVLDQLLGGADESGVSYRQAAALLGYTPDSLLDEFVDAFAAGDAGGVFGCVDKIIEVGQDPRRFAEDLLRRLRDLVIAAAVPDALTSGLVDVAPDQAERLASQAAALGAGELTRAAEVVATGLTDMRGTTAPRLHLELMCARVLLPVADLFEGRRQLIVYRAFYAPDVTTYPASGGSYPERACIGCSFGADQVAHPAHLNARDTTLVYVSRAPQAEIQSLKERMGWGHIPWYTLTDDFDKDFGVDQWHGHNAFLREGDRISRPYFVAPRGDEHMGTPWSYLDTPPLGRQEGGEDSPGGPPQPPPYQWWNYHDAYGENA